jgi:hypothetical protein
VFAVLILEADTSIDCTFSVFAALFSELFFVLNIEAKVGAITNDTMDISLIRIFIDGPDVSLKGSPTVSPVTEAL